ncbi:SDR family oxidoreductase [Halosimplex sp. TS25]|uniref:SDR family oxidoreductase n=1 Tax=Halosimplex rarum TaxID=3396619 RepID=UPI0039EBEA86
MGRTLLTGATGTLGRELQPRLVEADETVRAASRSPPDEAAAASERPDAIEWVELDLADGTGLDDALGGVDVVVHAATAPQGDAEAVDVRGTERLLDAAESVGVDHVVYPSIVGIDDVPYSYYQRKLAAEAAVQASDVPATILRATQFHQFVDELLGLVARLPVWPLPTTFRVQPIDAREVAAELVDCATGDPQGRAQPVGGPGVRTLGELATSYREARGLRRPILRLPFPGAVASALRNGAATCPDRAVGAMTWEEWLAERYGAAAGSGRVDTASS